MSTPGEGRTIDALTMVLLMVCLGLIAGVLVLASQTVRLKKELGSHTIRSADQVRLSGATFPNLAFKTPGGEPAALSFGTNGALLLIFSSDCPDCVAALPDWEELFRGADSINPELLPVYGVQLDMPALTETGSDRGMARTLPFPVLGPANQASMDSLRRIHIIPAAVVLDSGNTVVDAWIGRPGDEELEQISALLGL